jgi:hypothetical protein
MLIRYVVLQTVLGAFVKLRKVTISFMSICLSVCPSVRPSAWNNSARNGGIFMKFDIWVFFKNLSRKFKFLSNLTERMGTLHEDLCTFMIVSRRILLRKRKVSQKRYRESQNTHFVLNNFFPKIVPFMR